MSGNYFLVHTLKGLHPPKSRSVIALGLQMCWVLLAESESRTIENH